MPVRRYRRRGTRGRSSGARSRTESLPGNASLFRQPADAAATRLDHARIRFAEALTQRRPAQRPVSPLLTKHQQQEESRRHKNVLPLSTSQTVDP